MSVHLQDRSPAYMSGFLKAQEDLTENGFPLEVEVLEIGMGDYANGYRDGLTLWYAWNSEEQ